MAQLKPQFTQLSEDDIIAIVAIGRQQGELMNTFEDALQACDTLRALGVGLPCEVLRALDAGRALVGLEKQVKQ